MLKNALICALNSLLQELEERVQGLKLKNNVHARITGNLERTKKNHFDKGIFVNFNPFFPLKTSYRQSL